MNAITPIVPEAAQGAGVGRSQREGTDLLYVPGEKHFVLAAKMATENGWSVFPQERDEKRRPGRVGKDTCPKGWGTTVAWGQYRDRHPTPEEMAAFSKDCATLNVAVGFGPANANTFCFDVDCTDRVVSARIQTIIEGLLGPTPLVRIGREPRAALIYRTAVGDGVRSVPITKGTLRDHPENGVEILGNSPGMPLTILGPHWKSGRRFVWPRDNPMMVGPEAATLVTSAQVDAVMAAIAAEFPFARPPVPPGGEVTEADWDASTTGYRKPRLFPAGEEAKATDGREIVLRDTVYRAVAGNGHAVLRANKDGTLDTARSALCAVVLEAFEEAALTGKGRWGGQALKKEVAAKVGHAVGKLLREKIKPWVARPGEEVRDEYPEPTDEDLAFDPAPVEGEVVPVPAEDAATAAAVEQEVVARMTARAEARAAAHAVMEPEEEAEADPAPYQCLGHDDGKFFILGRGGQVREFTAENLNSKGALYELAEPQYWADRFYSMRGGVDTAAAQASLMEACFAKGVYNPDGVRGRGVWLDAGRTVMHLGDVVLVDGVRSRPQDVKSRFTYEASRSFNLTVGEPPMEAEESKGLLNLMDRFSWERPGMGRLFAGWCTLAPVCGALPWRPHAWLTAEPGTGKSWLLSSVALPIIGSVGLSVQGGTTEAGIRQGLRQDARPVIFDESEGQTEGDRARIQKVLNLARQSSTGAGAEILLGTSDQKGASFTTKATFLFSSANVGVQQAADQRRWLVLTLVASTDPAEREAAFERIQEDRNALFAKADFGPRLLSRTLKLLPSILGSIDLLVAALVRAGGDQATAWTVAVPLAGAWHLQADASPTAQEADAYVLPYTSKGSTAAVQRVPEWRQCLDYLLQQRVEFREADGSMNRRSLGSLIASGANNSLLQYGVRQDAGAFVFAGNSADVARLMKGSTWGPSWAETLARAPGAKRRGGVRFTRTLVASSAVAVPADLVVTPDEQGAAATKEARHEPTIEERAWDAKAEEMATKHLTH